jgi:hypothetical protein
MHPTLLDTLKLIKTEHGAANALDKGGETPYYWHLLRVMLRLKNADENTKHIALLHDIVEDTNITLEDLKAMGYNNVIVEGVKWCSRNMFPELTFTTWMQKIGQEAPQEAILVKIADISDNLGYERMWGLMGKKSGKLITKKKINHQYPMQLKIDKKTNGKMRLFGEMGVFDRYYKGWNNIFETEKNLPLISLVNLEDFCEFSQLKELFKWLPVEEQNAYLYLNKLHTWQIEGTVNTISDKSGQPYLALVVEHSVGQDYQGFLNSKIESDFIHNQQTRDHNSYHVTLVNAMQYSKLSKIMDKNILLKSITNCNFKLFTYGIGTAIELNKNKQAWFTILENPYLDNFRQELGLAKQDFHMTLAFKNGDVFTQPKDKSSVLFSNKEISGIFNQQPIIEIKNKIKF